MKIGVLGPNGFIGFNVLYRYNWIPITREEINLLNKKSCERYFNNYHFDVIIHCAAVGGHRLVEDTCASVVTIA